MKQHYLYKITNLVNGKMYIGVTKNPEKRRKQHLYSYPTKGKNYPIRHAVKKYGRDNFSFEVLCIGSEEYIYELEKKAIIAYGTVRNGYNVAAGGKGGAGSEIPVRSDDAPIYVSGFWFPNRRICLKTLNVSASTLHGWKVSGKIGNECKLKTDSCIGIPVYVGSFWFYDIHQASKILGINEGTLKSRIRLGMTDQIVNNPGRPKVRVSIEGVEYSSLADAVKFSGYTIKMIRRRIANKNNPNFYIIEEVQNE